MGGSGHPQHRGVRVAVLGVSDTRTPDDDVSGATARRLLEAAGHTVVALALVPDEPVRVREAVTAWLADPEVDAVVVHGGTGLSPRDQTPEALAELIERPLPGFGELFRMLGWEQVGPVAMLGRAQAGIARSTALFSVPGSPRAVGLAVEKLIAPVLGHLVGEIRRDEARHRHAQPD